MTQEDFGKAFQSGFGKTVGLLRSRGASRDTAEDAAQAAWVRGLQKLNQLRNDAMVVAWVNTIAINVHRRTRQYEARHATLPQLRGHDGIDWPALDATWLLSQCSPRDRTLFEQQIGGLSIEEIARNQGVTSTAIRVRLLRARRAVRATVTDRAVRAL